MTLPDTLDLVIDGKRYKAEAVVEAEPPAASVPAPSTLIAYSQNDTRWKNQIYAGSTTFGAAGCLVVSVAMMVSLAYPERIEPPEVAARLRAVGAFGGAMLAHPARISQAFERLEWGGVIHWRNKPADISALGRELDRHGATICEVKWNPNGPSPEQANQHFIIVEGLVGNDALIVDPWDGKSKLLSTTRYRLSGWDAARTLYGIRLVRPKP
jgi:hypothetical protein